MLTKRKPFDRPADVSSEERIRQTLESGLVKNCPICRRNWPAESMLLEDGMERCPTCAGRKTQTFKAETIAEETAFAASREPGPQESQASLSKTFPGTVVKITDANGTKVYDAAPLRLIRNVATTLLLRGRSFSASDTITGPANLTISVSARTAVLTTLSITAGLTMTPGTYSLTFNSVVFRNLFSVR